MKQPILGLVGTGVMVLLALGFMKLFSFAFFMGWVAYVLTCMVPVELTVCVLWQSRASAAIEKLGQPAKGILLTLFVVVTGSLIAAIAFYTVGGGYAPPSPILNLYVISIVCFAFFALFVLKGWPFTLIPNRFASGVAFLTGLHVVGYVLFRVFFNFGFMAGAPVYVPSLDPHGLFNAWVAVTFYVAVVAAIFIALSFDLWPLTKAPKLLSPRTLPFVWGAAGLVTAFALLEGLVNVLKVDVVVVMVRILIAFVFGTIIVLIVFQGSLFAKAKQPLKGILNVLAAVVAGGGLSIVYVHLATVMAGMPLAGGAPQYVLEIWLASALLAVTFPFLSGLAGLFEYWPLVRPPSVAPGK